GADLRWKAANGNIRQVRVERVSSQTGEFAEVASVPATASAWIDPQVQPRSFYNYRLRFETPAGFTEYSTESRALIPPSYIPPPQPAIATAVSSSRINLLWTNSAPEMTGVVVERSSGGAFSAAATLGAASLIYRDSDVASATTYSYRLRAVTANGTSNASRELTATPPNSPALPDSAPRIHPAD